MKLRWVGAGLAQVRSIKPSQTSSGTRALVEALEPRTLLSTSFLAAIDQATKASKPGPYVGYGGSVYFFADEPLVESSSSLWKTDGTPAGTTRVAMNQGGQDFYPLPKTLLYIRNGANLWSTDGTDAGTLPL